jgi:membrane protease YdiL (CAAX protease family)
MLTSLLKRVAEFALRSPAQLPIAFPFGLKKGAKLYFKSLAFYVGGTLLPLAIFLLALLATPYLPDAVAAFLMSSEHQGLVLATVSAASFLCGFGMQLSVFRQALHSEGKRLRDTLGLNLDGVGGSAWKAIGLGLLTFAIAVGAEQLLELVYPIKAADPTADFMGMLKGTSLAIMISIALLAPVIEEIIFRGFLFRILRANFHERACFAQRSGLADFAAIFLSALVFGLMHLNFSALPFYIVLGGVFAESYRRTGCLYVPMVAHFLNNSLVVAMLLLK